MFLVALAADALACSFLAPPELEIVADPSDTAGPAAPVLGEISVNRGRGPRLGGASSCDDLGWLELRLDRPAGDPDAAAAVGYRFELVDGALPDGFALPARDGAPWVGPDLTFTWVDEATDAQEAFAFTVDVIPVDAAGNEGEPLTIEVADDGSSGKVLGCDTAGGVAGLWAVGAALLLARRRR